MNCSKELSYGQWRQCLKDFIVIKHFSQTEFVLFTTAYSLITLLGLLGNGLVIVVVISRPNMRTPRNVFITNLAAANFILSAIAIPFLWLPNYEVEFNHSLFFCKVASAFPGINIYCSTLTISIIAVDRYIVVACSRFGGDRMKVYQGMVISMCIWVAAFLLSIPCLLFYEITPVVIPEQMTSEFGYPATVLYQYCAFNPPCSPQFTLNGSKSNYRDCKAKYDLAINMLITIFLYVVPSLSLFSFNYMLTNYLKKSEKRNLAVRKTTTSFRKDSECPSRSSRAPLTSTQLSSVSGAAFTNCRRRRNRTTALLYAMAVSYAILWFPFIILSLYMQFTGQALDKTLDEVAKMVSILSTCVNPFLYGYLNTNFNREFKKIFGAIGKFCCRIDFINEDMLGRNNRRDVSVADMSRSAWNRLQWKNRVEIYRKRVSLALIKHRRSSLAEDPCHLTTVDQKYRGPDQQNNVLPLTELQFNNAVGDVEI